MERRCPVPSPLGPLEVVVSHRGVSAVRFPAFAPQPGSPSGSPLLARAVRQLEEYFAGERTSFDLPLTPIGTPFELRVWDELRRIPYGERRSYGQIARALGDPKKARAVGAANGSNPLAIVVPCHRVVGSDGRLTGYAGGLERKRWLLEHEAPGDQGSLPFPPSTARVTP